MGESIAEGTVSRWLKKVGEEVARDEPILEISTDKVDAEIPSPEAGTLVEIAVAEGQTVEVGTVLGFIETDREAATVPATRRAPPTAAASLQTAAASPLSETSRPPVAETAPAAPVGAADDGTEDAAARLRRRSTPLVRRIAEEHGVDLAAVTGTGHAGRVTKQDILAFIAKGPTEAAREQPVSGATPVGDKTPAAGPFSADAFWDVFYGPVRHPEFPTRPGDRLEPMNRIRRLTADHMVRAKRIAPHVHSFIEIDFTQIDRIRSSSREKWEQQGSKVSYTAFVAWAVAHVLREFPTVNATISGDNVIFRAGINIGIAVDLNPGLIVPVVRSADELNLLGIARRINDLALRARERKLNPEEIQGATFSITNPGVLGTVVGMPIIPEGTAAILGTGVVEKKPVVLTAGDGDVIAIRKRALFSLGYDHRIVDGADAARFLARLKAVLDAFPEDA